MRGIIYAVRARIVSARRMEADSRYDELYAPVVNAFDRLLEQPADGVDDDAWTARVADVLAELIFAALRESARCDLFLEGSRTLRDAGLE